MSELQGRIAELEDENAALKRELKMARAEAERYRAQCGRLLDAAQEIQRIGALLDGSGEVAW